MISIGILDYTWTYPTAAISVRMLIFIRFALLLGDAVSLTIFWLDAVSIAYPDIPDHAVAISKSWHTCKVAIFVLISANTSSSFSRFCVVITTYPQLHSDLTRSLVLFILRPTPQLSLSSRLPAPKPSAGARWWSDRRKEPGTVMHDPSLPRRYFLRGSSASARHRCQLRRWTSTA